MKNTMSPLAAALAMLLAAPLAAQSAMAGQPNGGGPGPDARLEQMSERLDRRVDRMAERLDLSDDQQAELKTLWTEVQENGRSRRDGTMREQLASILTQDQLAELARSGLGRNHRFRRQSHPR
jgi:Spy/CpxP family protein refolding chaperone